MSTLHDLSDQVVVARWREFSIRHRLDQLAPDVCWLHPLVPTKPNGYAQVFIAGLRSKPLLHHLAYRIKMIQQAAQWQLVPHYDVSHLCGNERCINPNHLHYEPSVINQRRKGCKGSILVECDHCHSKKRVILCECSEHVKCIGK